MPNVITYNALISACEKGKQPDRALEIFDQMQQQGLVPDVITYSALISACEQSKQPEQAMVNAAKQPLLECTATCRFRFP